ncbi:hypothetical protein BBI01_17015 [Chryseobacterium artocarpi]|uniref:Uncharacterized protein n=1 Tax=Chryseobacterium artocarpi TaxID=1414727 RepID=A0A1B8ZBC0_9FLAO|nr:hypothetical protein [Elizabethkingia anophelis]MDV3877161.1 hypothetical protein [Elizabethkingia anophelis]MDV3969634.1 hypothetical protein [Elizabethkingia anophelis]OCA68918.1 hypothetical protein BBI01_17015 [Chryseobacterium artocarpi]OPC39967.1 hypothetical protein BAY02_09210 [Elizabethkingia anophelis]
MISPSANNVHRQVELYFEKAGKIYLITIFPLLSAKNLVIRMKKRFHKLRIAPAMVVHPL